MEPTETVYLDNASTTWPKPHEVYVESDRFFREEAANPGRGAHRLARRAGEAVDRARRALARLLGAPDPRRVVFGLNATDGLNTALRGLLGPGDRVLTSALEHNAVVRPIHRLRGERGVLWEAVRSGPDGTIDLQALEDALARRPTRLVALCHASNVTGAVQPVAEVSALARRHGALLLVDAAQTAGAHPIDVARDGIDLLAFSGHKALLGPTGTGGLIVAPGVEPASVRQGGTGSLSESFEQPRELPERLEAGTRNAVGLAGLAAGVGWIETRGVATITRLETELGERLAQALRRTDGVTVIGWEDPAPAAGRVGVVSFNLGEYEPGEVAAILDQRFGIAVRAGLHCSPLAHRSVGTFPAGTVRASLGPFSTEADVDRLVAAVAELTNAAGA